MHNSGASRGEITESRLERRYCEEQSGEAIQTYFATLDCFAELVIGLAEGETHPVARNDGLKIVTHPSRRASAENVARMLRLIGNSEFSAALILHCTLLNPRR
jgi:hypothetical protein